MAKATGRKAADPETKAKKKPAATTKASAATHKPVAKKPAAKKPAAKKPAVKKVAVKTVAVKTVAVKTVIKKAVAPKKPAATKAKAAAKATNPVTTVKSRTRKPSAQPQTVATTVESPARKSAAKLAAVTTTVESPARKSAAKLAAVTATVESPARKSAAKPAAVAATGAKKQAAVRARRPKSAVLEVSPAVIDTTSAAEVAARLVIDAHGPAPLAPSPLGNLFDAPPVVAVKRGSSAFRHVKESLNKPVARQLEGVFGPAPVPPETMRRFLKGEKTSRTQRGRGTGNLHLGQSSVPHRSVG